MYESKETLVLIKKYDEFVEYIYNPLIHAPIRHKIIRDKLMEATMDQYSLFHKAVKSNQLSRIYEADAGLATIRSYLRIMGSKDLKRRVLSLRQCSVAETILSESGKMLGAMTTKVKKK